MKFTKNLLVASLSILCLASAAHAAVSADEAAQLKTTLTPLGGEKAGNKDGTIPAWTGAPTEGAGLVGGKRQDPYGHEKPLFSITSKNMAQYAEKLTEGAKALLQKYPNSYRIDVYKTYRTAIAPKSVYDATLKNATNGKLIEGPAGPMPTGVYGGVPFPIPKSATEVMWNHALRWRGESWYWEFKGYQGTQDGQWVNIGDTANDQTMPYYAPGGNAEKFNGDYWLVRSLTKGPAIRAGEAITGRLNTDESKTATWVYLTGQRRVRKLPNSCCDTPTPFSAGIASFDEVEVFNGRMDRFDWKLIGKKEIYIPYNSNKTAAAAKDTDLLGPHHLNPDYVRWELHRVWVVEATLKQGQRHTSPKSRYYIDEDSWTAVIAERYDASGQLTRVPFTTPVVMSDVPATVGLSWGIYDLIAGSTFVNGLVNERKAAYKTMPAYKDSVFTPEAMSGEGVR